MADLQISANMEQAACIYDMVLSCSMYDLSLEDDDYSFMWEWLEVEDFCTHFGYILH